MMQASNKYNMPDDHFNIINHYNFVEITDIIVLLEEQQK